MRTQARRRASFIVLNRGCSVQSKTGIIDHRPELIFALVGPLGVRLDDLTKVLKTHLKLFGYESINIPLSDLLINFTGVTKEADTHEDTRISHRQDMGLQVRKNLQNGAALALAGIAAIREQRAVVSGSPDHPAFGHAFIIRQLKHPDEVELLREVYGSSFILLAGHATRTERVNALAERMAKKDDKPGDKSYRAKANSFIDIDDKQDDDDGMGQNTRDTYPLADFFANLGIQRGEHSVTRFVDLLFGHPFHTPFPEEYAMYQASAGSLRSSDASRQVGAVIAAISLNQAGSIINADIVATGMNEVPRRGGTLYMDPDSPDGRDQWLIAHNGNDDRARSIKISALAELLGKIKKKGWLHETVTDTQENDLAHSLLDDLKRTQFMDIGEFMRPVHAEMAALIDSARRGVAVKDLSMYVTTFPCHNCAKHIIAAGIQRVVYLEPYPKSRAELLHGEEINFESTDGKRNDERVIFLAFSGIAPRQYQQLFSMAVRSPKTKKGISLKQWPEKRATLIPRYVMRNASESYILAERQELEKLSVDIYKWDKNAVCPS